MIYTTPNNWLLSKNKVVTFFGMSGVGKSYISSILCEESDWFHYSVDYRIGTVYLSEKIREILNPGSFLESKKKVNFLENPHMNIHNISLLSQYLGKPGNSTLGGIPFKEYLLRQKRHKKAEIKATVESKKFFEKILKIGKYQNFICDTSGSLCEIVDADNPNDKVLKKLSEYSLLVWIKGSEEMTEKLIERFCNSPKPMYYNENFLKNKWNEYLELNDLKEEAVDPNDFIIFGFKSLIKHRLPIYKTISQNWGISIDAGDINMIRDKNDFIDLISSKIKKDNK